MSPRHKTGEIISIGAIPAKVGSLYQIVLDYLENRQIDSLLIKGVPIRRIRADLRRPGGVAFVFGDRMKWERVLAEDRLKPSSIELVGLTDEGNSVLEVLLGRIKVLPLSESKVWTEIEVLESGARDSLMLLGAHLSQVLGIPLSDEITKQREKAAGGPRSRKQRKRGPNAGTLQKYKHAMEIWLDGGVSITAASQTAGTYPETVRRWMRNVLKTVDEETKVRWTKRLRAFGELTEF